MQFIMIGKKPGDLVAMREWLSPYVLRNQDLCKNVNAKISFLASPLIRHKIFHQMKTNQRVSNTMLTEEQKRKYEATRQMAKDELERIDKELEEEVIRTRQRIEELQQIKKAIRQIHEAACSLLGIKSLVEMKDYGLVDLEKKA